MVLAEYYNTVTKKTPKCEENVKCAVCILSIKKALNKLELFGFKHYVKKYIRSLMKSRLLFCILELYLNLQ